MLVTLLPPTAGTARVAGFDVVRDGPRVRAAIGAALQEAALDPLLTADDHIKPTAGPTPPNWKPYLEKLPNDPWGRPYQYLNPGVKAEIDVMSFGADGQAGGEGKNADIGSWQ